jgi:Rha family phage regulatory protein
MNELKLTNLNGIETVDSRQVAEAVGKEHNKLLRDIRTYCEYLGASKIGHTDFFIESSYTTEQNKTMPCYLVTRKGCEMIANKLTGKKGVTFTAMYVNAFHDMENKLQGTPKLYGKKSTSAGEVASLIKVLKGVMKDQKSDPEKIALMAKTVCDQFGVNLPDKFVEKKPFDGQLFLVGFVDK